MIRINLRDWAQRLAHDVVALWLAARDPRVPWFAKVLAGAVAAYALSPIDLIPDFIPVLGLLDDALIVPAGLWLFVRLLPPGLMDEHRRTAAAAAELPRSATGAVIVILAWIAAAAFTAWLLAWAYY